MAFTCQPCQSQSIDKEATVLCTVCEQFLCEDCHSYHKVLKITKDHKLLKIDDYIKIADFLSLLETKCPSHPEMEIKYQCPLHSDIFCVLCKNKKHKDCTDIRQIGEGVSLDDAYSKIEIFAKKLGNRISVVDIICENRQANIEKLKSQREEFTKDLKEKRKQIDLALDTLELELKGKFEIGYQFEKRKLEDEIGVYEKTKSKLQNEHDQLVKINEQRPLSFVQLYLAEQHLVKRNDIEETEVNKFVEELSERSCQCILSLEISKSNRSITINDRLEQTSLKLKFESDDIIEKSDQNILEIETNVTDSSTIEEEIENCEDSEDCLQIHRNNDDESQELEKVTQNETLSASSEKGDGVSKSSQFMYSKHFTILKRDKNTILSCVKHLPNGYLLFGEESQPRLLIYDKSGNKKRQIEMKSVPESIAIIDKDRVAVTAGNAILLVNFNTLEIDKTFVQYDTCYGVAFINKSLLVNCETTGLKVLDLCGVEVRTFNSVKGILYMTVIEPETLIYVENGSQLVNFFNIGTEDCISYTCPYLKEVTGITTDTNKNVYVSCYASDKIYRLEFGSEKWETILTHKDEIFQPECVDFHKDVLYIVNDGRVVYTYRQKSLKRYLSMPCLSLHNKI